jgi:hypothetical protein
MLILSGCLFGKFPVPSMHIQNSRDITISVKGFNVQGLSSSSNITNMMQRYTIFFITVNAVHVSGGETP